MLQNTVKLGILGIGHNSAALFVVEGLRKTLKLRKMMSKY